MPALLAEALSADPGLRIGLYYEPEGYGDPPVARLRADLAYVYSRYGGSPNYLRVGGRPVLFVYSADDATCAVADRWHAADPEHRFHVVLKVFPATRPVVPSPTAGTSTSLPTRPAASPPWRRRAARSRFRRASGIPGRKAPPLLIRSWRATSTAGVARSAPCSPPGRAGSS